jgi:Kef-type K+ transport system membrane component KefB
VRLALIVVFGSLMFAARSFAPPSAAIGSPALTSLSVGYLLLTAFLAGSLFKKLGLPRLTGYLVAGMVAGPYGIGLLTSSAVAEMAIVNGVAISLIALTAGTEMHLPSLRPLLGTIAAMTLFAILGTALLLSGAVYLLRDHLPFLEGLGRDQLLSLCLVLGVTTVAQSPAVAVALRDEMGADGPMTRTVLAVVVLADLVVILLFAFASSLAQASFGGGADAGRTAMKLAWEIIGSGVAGLGVGALLALYLEKVPGSGALFVLVVAFVVAEVGSRLDLSPLLVCLSAGMLIRNVTDVGEALHAQIESSGMPVYVAFFGVAGATIHLDALAVVGPVATALVVVRALGFVVGTRAAARAAGAPEVVRRYVAFGLMPQAGLALALALLFARTFPTLGEAASALVFAVVGINELFAPILFRLALKRSGEAGVRDEAQEAAASPAAAETA